MAVHREEPPLTPQNGHQQSGLHFARYVKLPHVVGLAGMLLPIAPTLASHPPLGWWWLVLVGWALVWPHLAWQIVNRVVDPLSREIYNLKTGTVLARVWVGAMGVGVLPSTAMLMIICLNSMRASGPRPLVVGLVLMVVSCLVTLELTGVTVSFNSASLGWWLSLLIIVIYPLPFGRVSYQIATELVEHKRRPQAISTHDGMTGVYNQRHWETTLCNEFDNYRRHSYDMALLIIDIDYFESINNTWGHDVGDEVIVALIRQLQTILRGNDVIDRFDGDESTVIMSGTPVENVITAILRVHEGLNALHLPNTSQAVSRISVGVTPLNPQMSHYHEWLKSAGLAFYRAKKAGRNHTEMAA